MNYLPRNKFKPTYSKKVLTLAGVFLAGLLLFSLFDTLIIAALSPIWKAENVVTNIFRQGVANWRSRQTLIDENMLLKEQLTSLELQSTALNLARDREESLLALLGRKADAQGVIAGVLTRPPQSPYDLIVIDAGSDEMISPGSIVTLPEGPLLGVVSELLSSSAKVRLFSTAGEKTEAILERHSVPVILEGNGGGNFRIVLPRDTEVEVGDRIISPNLSYRLLAVVGEVKVEATDSFKEVLARSPANVFTLRWVSVLP